MIVYALCLTDSGAFKVALDCVPTAYHLVNEPLVSHKIGKPFVALVKRAPAEGVFGVAHVNVFVASVVKAVVVSKAQVKVPGAGAGDLSSRRFYKEEG